MWKEAGLVIEKRRMGKKVLIPQPRRRQMIGFTKYVSDEKRAGQSGEAVRLFRNKVILRGKRAQGLGLNAKRVTGESNQTELQLTDRLSRNLFK